MSQKASKHLKIGTLVAFSEYDDAVQKNSEVSHIESCSECSTLFNFLVKFGKAAQKSQNGIHTKCPKSDMDDLAFFLTFFRNGLPKEEALRFLRHINGCLSCFEIFVANWSAYLQGREN